MTTTKSSLSRGSVYLADLWQRREFIQYLAIGNLKARNASTVLGVGWWILNPLLLSAVYYLVFGIIFLSENRPDDYIAYLLTGMLAFQFTASSMSGSVQSILANAKLLANLRFPRLVLPISSLVENLAGFLVAQTVLVVILLVGGWLSLSSMTWLFPVVLVIHSFFNLGVGSIVARLTIPFRDLNNLVPYWNRLWLYLTPIIWPISMLESQPAALQTAALLNPLTSIVGLYRVALLGYEFEVVQVYAAVGWGLAMGIFGIGLFVKNEGSMVRHL